MARFYGTSTEPTLFGEIALVRCWGRIGSSGRQMTETFASQEAASAALLQLTARKRRRGYVLHD